MKFDLRKTTAVLLGSCLLTAGCLLKETTHTLYLDPDGSVTWSVLEREVRSDRKSGDERNEEEGRYLDAVRSGEGAIAVALRQLGGRRVRAKVLREDRPYAALSEARFSSARRLIADLLEGLGLEGDVRMAYEGDLTRLSLAFDDGQDPPIAEDDPLIALLEDADRYRIVLTQGTFVEAGGFALDDSKTIATFVPDAEPETHGKREFFLSWIPQ